MPVMQVRICAAVAVVLAGCFGASPRATAQATSREARNASVPAAAGAATRPTLTVGKAGDAPFTCIQAASETSQPATSDP